MLAFSPSSRGRLTDQDLGRFPGDTLFDRLARAVCEAGCLPRKELYEAWEMARRVRRLFRGGRIVDLGGGHGLLAQIMLLLDDSSPSALVVDKALPPSSARLHDVAVQTWPRLSGPRGVRRRATRGRRPQPSRPRRVEPRVRPLTDVVLDAPSPRGPASPCCRAATISPAAMPASCRAGSTARSRSTSMRAVRLEQQRLPHLDADDSRRHYAEEPAAARFAPALTHGNRTQRQDD